MTASRRDRLPYAVPHTQIMLHSTESTATRSRKVLRSVIHATPGVSDNPRDDGEDHVTRDVGVPGGAAVAPWHCVLWVVGVGAALSVLLL